METEQPWGNQFIMALSASEAHIHELSRGSRRIKIWTTLYVGTIILCIAVFWFDSHRRFSLQIDRQLRLGAQAVMGVLPYDYHDRALQSDSISRPEHLLQMRRLTDLANTHEFHYLYTMVQKDGRIFFTTSSLTDAEWKNIDAQIYFMPYPEAPPALYQAFASNVITYAEYTDRWGTFRSVFLPARSPGGHSYMIGADFDLTHLRQGLLMRLLFSLGIGLLAGLAALPILIDQYRSYRTQTRILNEWTESLKTEVTARTAELSREIAERKVFESRQAFTIRLLERIQQPGPDAHLIPELLAFFKEFTGMDHIGLRLREGSAYPFYRLPPPDPGGLPSLFSAALKNLKIGCPLDDQGKFPLTCLCGAVIEKRLPADSPHFTPGGSFFCGEFQDTGARLRIARPPIESINDCFGQGVQTLALIPITAGATFIGLLYFSSPRPHQLTVETVQFLENVAGTVGMALHRNQLVEDLKANQRKLQQALADLRQAQKTIVQQERLAALGQLVSGLSHDLNNTLMPIRGLTQFILSNPDLVENHEEIRRLISIIAVAGRDATAIVQRLKQMFTAPVPLHLQKIETEFLMDDLLAAARLRWEQATPPVSIQTELNIRNLDEFWADEVQIREALLNLIYNAADAMPQGGTLTLSAGKEGEWAVLSVRDTGTGMSAEVREKCLEPFFTTKGKLGTGMGLIMVHQTVVRHGGELDIQSNPGQGTLVRILLPLKPPVSLPVVSELPTLGKLTRPLKIVVIDDNPIASEIIRHFLARDGHDVRCLIPNATLIDQLEETAFDLVISDRIMPDLPGEEVVRWVKSHHPDCPVILITGYPVMPITENRSPSEADVLLEKPITAQQLNNTIATLIQRLDARGRNDAPPA